MGEDIAGRVRDIASRVAASYGLEIFDVQYRREASGMVLRIRIDRPHPVRADRGRVRGRVRAMTERV